MSGMLHLTEFLCLRIEKASKQTIEHSVFLTRDKLVSRIKFKIWTRLNLVTDEGQKCLLTGRTCRTSTAGTTALS